jgi:peptidoglycan/xylan/chitin deacetylase (PgdA/CDA1 family)
MRPYKLVSILFLVSILAVDYAYFMHGASFWWLAGVIGVYINLLVLGTIFIQWNFYIPSLNKGNKKQLVALSFDDGPAQETAAILDVLKAEGVEAAFFSIGKNAVAQPALVKRWDEEGHAVGNHSYHHGFNFDWKSAKAMAVEMEETNTAIKNIIGRTPKLFRPPYGVTNPNLAKAVKRTGMHSIGWSVRSFDTAAKDPQELLERILLKVEGGDIILLHDSMPITREILTSLIRRLREKGFTFARLDKMLEIDAYA